jgi:DNA processing protein
VIEAPKESGSLVTARFALEQNRDVFVVPGPVRHPNFAGSHSLVRSGAELVTTPEDIIETLLPGSSQSAMPRAPLLGTEEEKRIFEVLSSAKQPCSVDKIIELTNLKPKNVNQILTLFVLRGAAKESEGGYILLSQ